MKFASNTKKAGSVRLFFFQEKKKFIGVCLELDIVKEGTELERLRSHLREAVEGYVEVVCKERLPDELLNRPAPKKYWDRYASFVSSLEATGRQTSHPRVHQLRTLDVLPLRELCTA